MNRNNLTTSPLQSLRETSSPDVDASDIPTIWARYQKIVECDKEKNAFLTELLHSYDRLKTQYQHELQTRQYYEEYSRRLQIHVAKDPFVVVLIDGDDMIFRDEFIQAGEEGGRKAAQLLHDTISTHMQNDMPNLTAEVKIVCRVYGNVRGLADTLIRGGTVNDLDTFEQFTRGFTLSRPSFCFVDVGPANDRDDSKIIDDFKRHLSDLRCHQIYFGCSQDNGYARILEQYTIGDIYLKRITLLEGVPFDREIMELPFSSKKFPEVFRDTKLSLGWGSPAPNAVTNAVSKNYNMLSGLPSRFPPPPRTHSVLDSPMQPLVQPNFPRTPSVSTLASSDGWSVPSKKPTPVTSAWATVAAAPAPPAEKPIDRSSSPIPAYKPANRDELIARNRHGQRVDPQCRDYDKAEVDRVKKLKMCNVHFLRQTCPYGSKCAHLHDYRPTKDELATLRLVARMAPCQNGSGCEDAKCIFGHRCPAPRAKNGVKGAKSCIFRDNCKFPVALHDVDCNVVKTLVIR